jgi:hypothetical protein
MRNPVSPPEPNATSTGPGRAGAAWLALIVAGFAAASQALSVHGGPLLWPFTDAFEYASMTHWMLEGEGPVLRIGPAFFPARVPPVLSALLLPQAVLDPDPRHFWVSVFACGAVVLLATFRLAGAFGLDRAGALAATALVATSPGVAAYSALLMSDVPALAAWLVACACALRVARCAGAAPAALLAGSFAAGLLVAFRATNAVWLLPLAVTLPVAAWRGMLRRSAVLLAASLFAALPPALLALYHLRTFGSPVATGYAYWLDESSFFAAERIGDGLAFYAAELAGLRSELLARPLGWTSDLHALPVALLGVLGIARAIRGAGTDAAARRLLVAVAIGALASVALLAGLRWREGRFLFPVVPLFAIGAALAIRSLGARMGPGATPPLAVGTVAIAAALVLLPLPTAGPLVAALERALPRAAAPAAEGEARIEPTRLPLALAALFAPRQTVLVPSCDEPIGRDVQLELIRRHALRPLRVDPGQEALLAALPRWREERCTKRSPSSARDTRPGSR